ncbi:MAG: PilN domain-containing protein [Burkholderiaceae bacterium]
MTTPRVNLLPHREARRERQKKVFWVMTALSAVAGLLMIAVVWTVLQGYISNQESRNEFVRAENRKLDTQIKEIATLRAEIDGLRARQRAVEDLQADRNLPVYLIDEVAKQVPEGIYLKTIKQEDKRVNVTGWAASNERVSEFLRNLQNNSRVLERPELIEIKVAGQGPQGVNRRVFEFSLNFSLKQTPERAKMEAQAGVAPKTNLVPTTPAPTAVQSTPNIVSSSAPAAPEKK